MKKDQLDNNRHTLAHALAAAVLKLYPGAKHAIGPAIDTGFYYDFDLEKPLTEADLKNIETEMKKVLKTWTAVVGKEVSDKQAHEYFVGNPYKIEMIEELSRKGEKLTFYTSGEYTDLCVGGHAENPSKIPTDSFKLDKIAGAYWRGDEKNKMLTRIYGLAFESAKALTDYVNMRAEAEKRDHRKLGKDLDLFVFSDTVGKGLPLWTERGATIRRILERFIVDEEIRRDYKHVYTPDIAKIDLYKKSGHYPYYKDSMYAPIVIDDEQFMLRPMTCPHHFELYLSKPRSYRELPMRIAELAKLYRYEQSGELSGLVRVRTFCLADAHIICADPNQAAEEIQSALGLIEYVVGKFGLKKGEDFWYRLSLGSRADSTKYFKDDAAWDEAEGLLRKVLKKQGTRYYEAENEAAFYGPKIDIQMKDVRGKENTAFTVQYDFVMPKRFNLSYTAEDGKEKQAVVVHRSSIGAIERVIAFLIEHFAGAFPLWLAPVQVGIIPIAAPHSTFAQKTFDSLKKAGIRAQMFEVGDSLGKRIREAKMQKLPYIVIIGDKEKKAKKLTVEVRGKDKPIKATIDSFLKKLEKEIKEMK